MARTAHPSKNQLTPFASPAEQRSGMNVVATRSSTNASPHSVPPPERGSERPRLGAGADLRAWDIAAGAPRRTKQRLAADARRADHIGPAIVVRPRRRVTARRREQRLLPRGGERRALWRHSRRTPTSSAEPSGRAWPWTRFAESRLWRQRCGATLFKW